MKKIPQISDSEWQIMKILWAKSPLTSKEIFENIPNCTNWKSTTVKTLISRLVKKNAISFKKERRTYNYYPLVSEKECIKSESETFLKKVYDGALNVLLANFIEMEKLSKEDIDELKKILEEKK